MGPATDGTLSGGDLLKISGAHLRDDFSLSLSVLTRPLSSSFLASQRKWSRPGARQCKIGRRWRRNRLRELTHLKALAARANRASRYISGPHLHSRTGARGRNWRSICAQMTTIMAPGRALNNHCLAPVPAGGRRPVAPNKTKRDAAANQKWAPRAGRAFSITKQAS